MTAPARITVSCNGRPGDKHRRHDFNTVTITGDGIKVNVLRKANAPDLAGQVIDGTALPGHVLMRAYDPHHGNQGWRWLCPVCGVDRRFASDDRVRSWLLSQKGRVADIARGT